MTKPINDVIMELYAGGVLVREIARRVGLTLKPVEHRIRRLIDAGRIVRRRKIRPRAKASPETIAKIRQHFFTEQLTAEKVGALLGMTRNQVLGICYRNGIRKDLDHKEAVRRRAIGRWGAGADSVPPPLGGRKALAQIGNHDCRYPNGEPGNADFRFCGAPVAEGHPYCPYHCSVCYRPREAA